MLRQPTSGGRTPILPLDELYKMSYTHVGCVLTGLFAAARALQKAYGYLLALGGSSGLEGELMPFREFTSVIGLAEKYALEEKYRVDGARHPADSVRQQGAELLSKRVALSRMNRERLRREMSGNGRGRVGRASL